MITGTWYLTFMGFVKAFTREKPDLRSESESVAFNMGIASCGAATASLWQGDIWMCDV